jgi:hypothetical protein
MAHQNAPLTRLLSVVDAAGVTMAPPADRVDGSYMDAGNYSRSWAQPSHPPVAVPAKKIGFKSWLLSLRLGRMSEV